MALKPPLSIRKLAEVYADAYSARRREIAEAKHLKPLRLDANALIDRSQDIKSELLTELKFSMQQEGIEAETIIAGRDETGPHLFVITDPGVVACADAIAFASIGSGKGHADSYFMMAHHTRQTLFHKALLDAYIAKRRSEVSPTVGTATDLFYIGPQGFQDVEEEVRNELERIRNSLDARARDANAAAAQEAADFISEYVKKPAQPTAPNPPSPNQQADSANGSSQDVPPSGTAEG
jgi:hypothetical protein